MSVLNEIDTQFESQYATETGACNHGNHVTCLFETPVRDYRMVADGTGDGRLTVVH